MSRLMESTPFVSLTMVAEMKGCSWAAVQAAVERGDLPYVEIKTSEHRAVKGVPLASVRKWEPRKQGRPTNG